MNDLLAGPLRALVPAFVAYLVGKGIVPAGAAGEVVTALLALGAAGWSVASNRRSAKVAAVAAMPGTVVSGDGRTISIVEPDLARAAKEAATGSAGH